MSEVKQPVYAFLIDGEPNGVFRREQALALLIETLLDLDNEGETELLISRVDMTDEELENLPEE